MPNIEPKRYARLCGLMADRREQKRLLKAVEHRLAVCLTDDSLEYSRALADQIECDLYEVEAQILDVLEQEFLPLCSGPQLIVEGEPRGRVAKASRAS